MADQKKDEDEKKPWDRESYDFLRPKESDRMLKAGGTASASKPAASKPTPSAVDPTRDPIPELPVSEAERLRKKQETIAKHVGGGFGPKK